MTWGVERERERVRKRDRDRQNERQTDLLALSQTSRKHGHEVGGGDGQDVAVARELGAAHAQHHVHKLLVFVQLGESRQEVGRSHVIMENVLTQRSELLTRLSDRVHQTCLIAVI